ncbi:11570_t:CDS:2 [Acaulospora morrowiae]|uniref:11570_t:CDS:1 n=1 Tax=Acaulospora morrowiae TaxID=94023 RepID=A0A9N9FP92_9GLOM|nr:11570_t:CDS:2 [Acaulospora morrowiae]
MTENNSTKYNSQYCYGCQACLYCGVVFNCLCERERKPISKSKRRSYSRIYTPTQDISQTNFLKEKNDLYSYGIDFNHTFSFSFCSKCNSKYQRIKSLTKITETPIDIITLDTNSSDTVTGTNISNLKFKLLIKLNDGSTIPAKWINLILLEFEEFENFQERILCQIRSLLDDDTIEQKSYTLSYKISVNSPGTQLCDDSDFQKLLEEYGKYCIKASKKETMVIAHMKKEKNKKHSRKKPRHSKRKNLDSDTSASSSQSSQSSIGKNKKSVRQTKFPHISKLDSMEQEKAERIRILRDKYHCIEHRQPCYISDNMHLRLSPMHLTLWAHELVRGFTDINTPPMHAIFGASTLKKNHCPSSHINIRSTSPPIMNKTPSLSQFLQQLDDIYGKGMYTRFEGAFLQEDIAVVHIKDLSDVEFEKLGVTKIGWRHTLKQAASHFQ